MVNKQVPNKNSNKIQEIQNYKEFIITKKRKRKRKRKKRNQNSLPAPLSAPYSELL